MSEARVSIVFDGDSASALAASERLAAAINRLADAERKEAAAASAAAAAEKARSAAVNRAAADTERFSDTQQRSYQREIKLRRDAQNEMDREFSKRARLSAAIRSDAQDIGHDMDILGRGAASLGRGVSGISALGAAIGGLAAVAPAITPLLGSLALLPAAFGALAGGVGVVKMLGLDEISKASTQLDTIRARMKEISDQEKQGLISQKTATSELAKEQLKLNAAAAGLSGPQLQALVLWRQVKETFEGLAVQVQGRVLPAFQGLAASLAANGGAIRSFFLSSASIIGNTIDQFSAITRTPFFQRQIQTFLRESTGVLSGVLTEALKLGEAFGGIAVAIEPAQHELGNMIDHVVNLFRAWTQGAGQADLPRFFSAMNQSLSVIGSLLAHVGQVLGHVFIDAYPASVRLVSGVDRLFQAFDQFTTGNGANIQGVFNGIADALGGLEQWIQQNSASISTILTSAWTIASNAIQGFMDTARLVAPVFSGLLQVIAPVASALASLSSAIGGLGTLGALVGAAAAIAAFRGALVGLKASLTIGSALEGAQAGLVGLLSPTTAIIAALVGAAVLWQAFSNGISQTAATAQQATDKLNALRDAVRGLHDAQSGALGATQAHKDAVWAYTDAVKSSKTAVADLQRLEKTGTATAEQLRAAHDRVTAAFRARADAATQVKITTQQQASADQDLAKKNTEVTRAAKSAADAFAANDKAARNAALATQAAANAANSGHNASIFQARGIDQEEQARQRAKRALDAYVSSNEAATGPLSGVNHALAELSQVLGHIPSRKVTDQITNIIQHGGTLADVLAKINAIRSKTVDITANVHNHSSTDAPAKHARGGVVQGPANAGDTIPIFVTPGEVVLNRSQQSVVGPGRISAALSGAASHFQSGGHYAGGKKPPATPRSHHAASISPSKLKSPNYPNGVDPGSDLGKAIHGVNAALLLIEGAQSVSSDDDKSYTNLARKFDIEAPNVTKFIPDPNNPGQQIEVRDDQGINTRVSQLQQLAALKTTLIADMDDQKKLMNEAVTRLKVALAKLASAIEETHKNLIEERKKAAELTKSAKQNRSDADYNENQARSKSDEIATERQKKKPDQKKLDTLSDQRRSFSNTAHDQRNRAAADDAASSDHKQNAARLEKRLGDLQTSQQNYTQKVGDLSSTLVHDIPFSRDGLVLDVEDLNKQIVDVNGTQSQSSSAPSTSSGGSGSSTPSAPSGGTTSTTIGDNPQIQTDLLAQIGALKLALAVQGAQLPVLGSFRSGVMHVPRDGVAVLHSGEKVVRPGVSDSASDSVTARSHVELSFKDSFADFVDARVLKSTDKLTVSIGNNADQRRREGRR